MGCSGGVWDCMGLCGLHGDVWDCMGMCAGVGAGTGLCGL